MTKTITARYPGTCEACGGHIEPGDRIAWDPGSRTTTHAECPEPHPSQDEDGMCGARGYEYAMEVRGFNDGPPEPPDPYDD